MRSKIAVRMFKVWFRSLMAADRSAVSLQDLQRCGLITGKYHHKMTCLCPFQNMGACMLIECQYTNNKYLLFISEVHTHTRTHTHTHTHISTRNNAGDGIPCPALHQGLQTFERHSKSPRFIFVTWLLKAHSNNTPKFCKSCAELHEWLPNARSYISRN